MVQAGPMPTVNVTQTQLYTLLRSFIIAVTGLDHVIQSQGNRVPMPKGPFATMTPMGTIGLSTNYDTYDASGVDESSGSWTSSRDTQWRCQLDFYGTGAADNCALVSTLTKSLYAADYFRSTPLTPLYSSDPLQTSMINGEDQWEERWTMDFIGQFNPSVTFPADMFDGATIDIVPIIPSIDLASLITNGGLSLLSGSGLTLTSGEK